MKLDQKGFSLVEGLLALIALTLVAGAGFYVVNTNKNDKKVASVQTEPQTTAAKPAEDNKYMEIKELGVKFDKSTLPTAYYKISASERQRAYPNVPELTMVQLFDTAYDNTANSKGVKCGDFDSSIIVVELMKITDRDKNYAKYKNAQLGPNDEVPTVVSGVYAKKSGNYLYDYYKAQGVQAAVNCIPYDGTSDFETLIKNNPNVQKQFDESYAKLKDIVGTISSL